MTKKTAEELVRTYPGVFERRREIILALCQCRVDLTLADNDPDFYARFIVAVANRIIEETECQGQV